MGKLHEGREVTRLSAGPCRVVGRLGFYPSEKLLEWSEQRLADCDHDSQDLGHRPSSCGPCGV